MVIKHAKELLKTTPLSIKEVSNQLKFVDSSLFCRYFRRCTGITRQLLQRKLYNKIAQK